MIESTIVATGALPRRSAVGRRVQSDGGGRTSCLPAPRFNSPIHKNLTQNISKLTTVASAITSGQERRTSVTRPQRIVYIAVRIGIFTPIVGAAMGTITMFATPGTLTPTLTVGPATIGAVGVFGAIVVVGVLTILGVTAVGGDLA